MGSTEKLEQVFRQIEEDSERRAREEAVKAAQPVTAQASESADSSPLPVKKRRRGSISVSRIGNFHDMSLQGSDMAAGPLSTPSSPAPWSNSLRNSTMYEVNAGSASSLTSVESDGLAHPEETHTTQKETIVGRRNTLTKAVGGILTKTLKHARSRNTLQPGHDDTVVIGVSVEEATVEQHETIEEGDVSAGPQMEQVSSRVLRDSNAAPTTPAKVRRTRSLVWVAKTLAKKFRRKSSKPILVADTA